MKRLRAQALFYDAALEYGRVASLQRAPQGALLPSGEEAILLRGPFCSQRVWLMKFPLSMGSRPSGVKRSAFVRSATASRQWIAASVSSAASIKPDVRPYSRHVTLFEIDQETPATDMCDSLERGGIRRAGRLVRAEVLADGVTSFTQRSDARSARSWLPAWARIALRLAMCRRHTSADDCGESLRRRRHCQRSSPTCGGRRSRSDRRDLQS
jgi:hypothetical protein